MALSTPMFPLDSDKDPDDGDYVLNVHIKRGAAYRLEKIILEGNASVSSLRLNAHLRNFQPVLGFLGQRRFIENDLTQSLKSLRQYYRGNYFPEVRLSAKTDKNDQTGQVRVTITITEGPRYAIEFTGNTAFSHRVLKRNLVFIQRGMRGDARFEKSIEQIKLRYRRAGFTKAQISVESKMDSKAEKPTRKVRFLIEEGPQTRVNALRFTGNQHITTRELQDTAKTASRGGIASKKGVFVPEILNDDIMRIKMLYRQRGFLDANLQKELDWQADQTMVDIRVDITEGPQTKVAQATVHGLSAVADERAIGILSLKPQNPFNPDNLQKDEKALAALLIEQGRPYATAKGRFNLSQDGRTAEINYDVTEGPLVRVGTVFYKGNLRTRTSFLQQTLGIKTDDTFSRKKLMEGQRDLRNLSFLSSADVKAVGLKEQRDTITLIVQVNERKPYYVEAGAGYQSDRGFFINGQLGDNNLLGRGQKGKIAAEISQVGYQFDGSVTEPRLFNTPITLTTGLFGKREEAFNVDFGIDTFGVYLNISLDKWNQFFFGLNSSLARIDQYQRSSANSVTGDIDESEFEPRSSFTLKPIVVFDRRDSVIRPKKGVFSSLSVEVSRAIENDLDNLIIANGDLRFFISPFRDLTLATMGRVGHAEPYDTTAIVPQDKLLYLGGIASVRGYEENLLYFDQKGNAVGGRNSLNTSLEARYALNYNFELCLFFDTGQITDLEKESVVDGWRSSLGIGLRYVTPIGPLGILYGYKLDRTPGEAPGRFHFSFGYTF